MKSLSLLSDDTTIKLGDTGTMVQFTATDNQAPVQLEENQTAQFRIKNDFGLVKTITATTTYNGLIFQFDTADLKGLVQGTYQVELAVNVDKDNTLIFPDDGFVSFTISANALSITGQQLNLISLDDFKEQIKDYVQQETQGLKDDFSNYVSSVKQGPKGEQGPKGDTGEQGPQGERGPQGADGITPTVSVGTVNTVSSSTPASVTNSGSGSNVVLDFNIPQGEKGDTGDIGTYCVSTGWLQSGFTFPSNASAIRLKYKIDTINGSSLLTLFCSVKFPKADMNTWGKLIATFPSNVTVDTTTNIFMYCVTAGGECSLKVKNNQIILNTWQTLGNVGSDGLVEFNFNGIYPVTLNS